ncbi:hypothetical protein Bbelb_373290 [Branchiostoma belcheri]|nr:hypothetical protein Bbelb_373290 [Branchiostoma belcheri]
MPHVCDVCAREFSRLDNMRRHQWEQHGQEPETKRRVVDAETGASRNMDIFDDDSSMSSENDSEILSSSEEGEDMEQGEEEGEEGSAISVDEEDLEESDSETDETVMSYATALAMDGNTTGTAQTASTATSAFSCKPVFFLEKDVHAVGPSEAYFTNVEVYKAVARGVQATNIAGIQQVRGLWRVYLRDPEERVKLIATGISLRNKYVELCDTHPFQQQNGIRVTVRDVPLSVDDSVIASGLKNYGVKLLSPLKREMLRVDGRLTNCETGDRFAYMAVPQNPNEHIPRFVELGGRWRARVFYRDQPKQHPPQMTHGSRSTTEENVQMSNQQNAENTNPKMVEKSRIRSPQLTSNLPQVLLIMPTTSIWQRKRDRTEENSQITDFVAPRSRRNRRRNQRTTETTTMATRSSVKNPASNETTRQPPNERDNQRKPRPWPTH